ncbi:MAG: hypothetical protein SPK26_09820 [Treponema sp.]|nr:hypothetical protein [Treponema sp.]
MIWVYIIIGLVVDVIVTLEFNEIAHMKGYNEKKYFWYCLLLGFFGYLIVMALPIKTDITSTARGNDLPTL